MSKDFSDSIQRLRDTKGKSKGSAKQVIGKSKRGRGRPKTANPKDKRVNMLFHSDFINEVQKAIDQREPRGTSLTSLVERLLEEYIEKGK